MWNARSLRRKLTFFQSLVYSKSFDLFCVTETWLSPHILDSEILPTGYTIYRQDRGSRGGGVLVAISNRISSSHFPTSTSHELLVIHLAIKPDTYICCAYLPPSSPVSLYTDTILPLCSLPRPSRIILVGDFNLPDVDWPTLSSSSSNSISFCDLLFSLNLIQLVQDPTHIQGNTLDLVFTNFQDSLSDPITDQSSCKDLSDHHLITFNVQSQMLHTHHSTPSHSLNYSKADLDGLQSHLLDTDLDHCLLQSDANQIWSTIKDTILNACHLYVPKVQLPRSPSPKWFTAEIKHSINKCRSLRRRIKRNSTPYLLSKLQTLEASTQDLIQSAKYSYEQHLVSCYHSNPAKLLHHLKDLSHPKSTSYPIIHESKVVTSSYVKASLFNSFFNSVFTVSNFVLPSPEHLPTPSSQLSSITINSSDVFKALATLNPSKTPGIDNIHPLILKICANTMLTPITHLLNTCIETCTIPSEWKIHKITPIHKGQNRSEVHNYRPISLLCILSKVLETIIYNNIIPFIYPLLSKAQFGFLQNRSCVTQLLSSFAQIYEATDKGIPCDTIFLDFKKAFDTIPHHELLYKLWSFGITGSLWSWFKAYLHGRSHLVHIEGCSSDLLPVQSGVPQGSVLGPLLFLLYVNDIPLATSFCSTYLFADDTKLLEAASRGTLSTHLQHDLDSLALWCSTWSMSLNTGKCASIRFSLRPTPITNYFINGKPIASVNHHKDLGVTVSSDLSWSKHIKSICASGYHILYLIRRSISSTSSNLKLHLYLSLVRSKLCYCSQIWRPRLIKDIICLERVQRRATKFILNDFSSENYKSRLTSLHILPLMYWLELQDILFLIRCLKNPPDNLDLSHHTSYFTSNTRAAKCNKMQHRLYRTSSANHFYYNRVARLWNKLPPIDLSLPLSNIKKTIYNHFWDHFLTNFNPDSPCTYHFICPCSSCSSIPHTYTFT